METDGFANLERRIFPRFKDNIFIFGNSSSGPIEEFKAFAKDISGGGLMLETEREISKASELKLEIYQPLDRDKRMIFSIPIMAKVIWIRNIKKNNFEHGENKYRIGIEFSEIKEEDRKIVAKYVEANLSKK